MTSEYDVVIIGAGPTGLGAAHRLHELAARGEISKNTRWCVVEAGSAAGGLAASVKDAAGFTWDLGGHVLFSHYGYFEQLMEKLLGPSEWCRNTPERWVWMRDRFIPCPLQANIWRLPEADLRQCLLGLLHRRAAAGHNLASFAEWLDVQFGRGLVEVFFAPLNFKMWAHRPQQMNSAWTVHRSGSRATNVPLVDLARVLENLVRQRDDLAWSQTTTFRYPRVGGTGRIFHELFLRLPPDPFLFNRRVMAIHPAAHLLELDDGSQLRFANLISTMPLDQLLVSLSGQKDLAALAPSFKRSSVHAIGLGIAGPLPAQLHGKRVLYFPEPSIPCYRATVSSNYSPGNVPDPEHYWSLLCEVSESAEKPVRGDSIVAELIQGLRQAGLLPPEATIVSQWHQRLPYGYPVPFANRDALLDQVHGALLPLHIYSRGRFGGWRYEVSNLDHSLMQGVEAVDSILLGTLETTYFCPDLLGAERRPWRN